jgi:hypothetical protein
MTHACEMVGWGLSEGLLLPSDVTDNLISSCMFTHACPKYEQSEAISSESNDNTSCGRSVTENTHTHSSCKFNWNHNNASASRLDAWSHTSVDASARESREVDVDDAIADGDPELLLRTSGETRLSDFLLWQCTSSYLAFIKPYWYVQASDVSSFAFIFFVLFFECAFVTGLT